jgi:hypothetical protein
LTQADFNLPVTVAVGYLGEFIFHSMMEKMKYFLVLNREIDTNYSMDESLY